MPLRHPPSGEKGTHQPRFFGKFDLSQIGRTSSPLRYIGLMAHDKTYNPLAEEIETWPY